VDLSLEMSASDIHLVSPIIEKYNMLMKCKNLNISVNADSFTPEELDLVHEFYSKLEEVQSKKKG